MLESQQLKEEVRWTARWKLKSGRSREALSFPARRCRRSRCIRPLSWGVSEDIAEIQRQVDLPVIGIVKRDYPGSPIYITPTMKEIEELMEVNPEIIAMDATDRLRPGGVTIDGFFREVKKAYPDKLFMADCSTVEEALHADALGFDFIGTTMVGYTKESEGDHIEANDFEILRKILAKAKHPVIAEGNIDTPDIQLGAYASVIGSIITRPQVITKRFTDALKEAGY